MKFPRPSWLKPPPTPIPPADSPVLANGHPGESATIAPKAPGGPPEPILVFPAFWLDRDEKFAPGRFCGFRTDAPEMVARLFPRTVETGDFRPRTADLEADEDFKQVVVAVVPWNRDTRQVWTYRRGGTEGRLDGKLSCLIGGHVNLRDLGSATELNPPLADLMDVLWMAALREMGEEVGDWQGNWRNGHSDCRLVMAGVVNEEETSVDRCHFGFLYRLDMARLDVPLAFNKESGVGQGWIPVDDILSGAHDPVESWTRHVVRHLSETSPVRSTT